MKMMWKTFMAQICNALGVLGWIYIGIWKVWKIPVRNVLTAHMAGSLSIWKLCGAAAEGFLFLSLAGGVWCIGYMLKNYFAEA